jgi:predicted transcriptional regulator
MTTFLTLRLSKDVLERLRELAKTENRSMSAQALHIIQIYLEQIK